MTRLQDVQNTVADWLGMQPKSRWERFTEMDWMPSARDIRGSLPFQQRTRIPEMDTTSLVVGMIVGVGLGVGLGYAMARTDVRRQIDRARGQVRDALDRVQEEAQNLPGRLNITRMEETSTKR